jgi:hypothetical protein
MTKQIVQRGKESWTSLWVVPAIVLSLEATVIQMIPRLAFPKNLIALAIVALPTLLLFRNELFQNWLLIQIKRFEKGRPH